MTKLSTEQMLYLLYTVSYSEEGKEGTVTKGTVKSYLPKDQQKDADSIGSPVLVVITKDYNLATSRFSAFVLNEICIKNYIPPQASGRATF